MKAVTVFFVTLTLILSSCRSQNESGISIRHPVDSVGFAVTQVQMDSVMSRLNWDTINETSMAPWKVALSPHDDYQYVNNIYPMLLHNIKSDIVILFGVAHRAAALGLSDSLVFDSHDYWSGPYGNVKVSEIREEITGILDPGLYTVNDSMHRVEHSLESMIPFLQFFNRDIEIIPILVPFMSPDRMKEVGMQLADAIMQVSQSRSLEFGKDISLLITSDAVHYGNEEWGGKDYAWFGCDEKGNNLATGREMEIIKNCLTGKVTEEKIALFSRYTLSDNDWREYKWSWCGRYSIPAGLYTAYYLLGSDMPEGKLVAYSTSINNNHIDFTDIGMGTTAIATPCHWVGYPAIGY